MSSHSDNYKPNDLTCRGRQSDPFLRFPPPFLAWLLGSWEKPEKILHCVKRRAGAPPHVTWCGLRVESSWKDLGRRRRLGSVHSRTRSVHTQAPKHPSPKGRPQTGALHAPPHSFHPPFPPSPKGPDAVTDNSGAEFAEHFAATRVSRTGAFLRCSLLTVLFACSYGADAY